LFYCRLVFVSFPPSHPSHSYREAEIKADIKKKEELKKKVGKVKVKAARISSLFARDSFSFHDDSESWQKMIFGGSEDEHVDHDDGDDQGKEGDSLDLVMDDMEQYKKRRAAREKQREHTEEGADGEKIVIHSKDHEKNTDYFNSRKTKVAHQNHFGRSHQKTFEDLDDGSYPETFSFMNDWVDDSTTKWLKKNKVEKW
jgi:hypothetical protein